MPLPVLCPDVATVVSRDAPERFRAQILSFSAHAVRSDADKIGWLPYQYYDAMDAAGRLVAVTRNGDLVGFATFTKPNFGLETKIIQCWVRPDARMIEHGRALVARVDEISAPRGAAWLSCWVATDLAAMQFWPAIGFASIQQRLGRGDLVDLRGRRVLTQFAHRIGAAVPLCPCNSRNNAI